jgi:hypothetical protein
MLLISESKKLLHYLVTELFEYVNAFLFIFSVCSIKNSFYSSFSSALKPIKLGLTFLFLNYAISIGVF